MTSYIASQRLHNQYLVGKPLEEPTDVVRWLCAVQAQDYTGTKWALAQRTSSTDNAAVDMAFNEGRILRTHVMRPTWHVVLPEDIRWLLQLTGPRVHAVNAHYYRKFELDTATIKRSHKLLTRALESGKQLTRDEVAAVYKANGITASGPRLAYLLMHAELDALVCSGPLRGKQFTYTLLDERVPHVAPIERDQALACLAQRYFASHGPATLHDFSWWSGLTIADGKVGVELASAHLECKTINAKTYWMGTPIQPATINKPVVHLLPNYDEHIVAYKDHNPSFDAETLALAMQQKETLFVHIITLNGLVVGGWRRSIEKKQIVITVNMLKPLRKPEELALRDAADRYGEFMGLPVILVQ